MTESSRELMKRFWEEKARENAMYYISSYRAYDEQDPEEFWKWGETLTDRYLKESAIPFTGRERVLEIGCGIGRMTIALGKRFREVVGIDISEEMVRKAREATAAHANIRISASNGVDLCAFADASFDFVFSYIVFQHIPDAAITKGYIRESGRVLKPGGWFHFQVNGEGAEPQQKAERDRLLARARRTAGRIKRGIASGLAGAQTSDDSSGPRGLDSPAWNGSRLSVAEVTATCAEAAMEVIRTDGKGTQYLWVTARKRGGPSAP